MLPSVTQLKQSRYCSRDFRICLIAVACCSSFSIISKPLSGHTLTVRLPPPRRGRRCCPWKLRTRMKTQPRNCFRSPCRVTSGQSAARLLDQSKSTGLTHDSKRMCYITNRPTQLAPIIHHYPSNFYICLEVNIESLGQLCFSGVECYNIVEEVCTPAPSCYSGQTSTW
jgi:hypothetical protein